MSIDEEYNEYVKWLPNLTIDEEMKRLEEWVSEDGYAMNRRETVFYIETKARKILAMSQDEYLKEFIKLGMIIGILIEKGFMDEGTADEPMNRLSAILDAREQKFLN